MKKLDKIIYRRSKLNEAPVSLSKKRFGKETWALSNEEKIQFAIENCRRIRITYDDKKGGKGKNTRYLLPLVYGVTKNGKKALRAFQTFGSTKRGEPSYKLFLFDNIGRVELGNIKYYQYEQELLNTGFNNAGDKSFAEIYSITPLARNFNSAYLANKNLPIDSNPVSKSDITKSQSKNQTDKIVQTPEQTPKKADNYIDKQQPNNYIRKTSTQNTAPVTKKEIGTDNQKSTNDIEKIEAPETEPVTKGEI